MSLWPLALNAMHSPLSLSDGFEAPCSLSILPNAGGPERAPLADCRANTAVRWTPPRPGHQVGRVAREGDDRTVAVECGIAGFLVGGSTTGGPADQGVGAGGQDPRNDLDRVGGPGAGFGGDVLVLGLPGDHLAVAADGRAVIVGSGIRAGRARLRARPEWLLSSRGCGVDAGGRCCGSSGVKLNARLVKTTVLPSPLMSGSKASPLPIAPASPVARETRVVLPATRSRT